MNLCYLNTQFGADTLNGAATLDWFNSRTGVALEIPDLDLDIELHSAATKPFNSSGELYTYNDNGKSCEFLCPAILVTFNTSFFSFLFYCPRRTWCRVFGSGRRLADKTHHTPLQSE